MAVTHSVTPADVRLKLGNPSTATLSDEQIQAEIDDAAVVVGHHSSDDATVEAVNYAVKAVAAFALLRESGGLTEVATELDIREEIDVDAVVDSLRSERDDALALVSADEGRPSLSSLGDRYP